MTRPLLGEPVGTAVFRNYPAIFEFDRQSGAEVPGSRGLPDCLGLHSRIVRPNGHVGGGLSERTK